MYVLFRQRRTAPPRPGAVRVDSGRSVRVGLPGRDLALENSPKTRELLVPTGLLEDGGGGTGIRTQETFSRPTVFKTAAFNHSAIPPRGGRHPFILPRAVARRRSVRPGWPRPLLRTRFDQGPPVDAETLDAQTRPQARNAATADTGCPRRPTRSPATPRRVEAPSASPAHLQARAWYRPSVGGPPRSCQAGLLRAR